MPNIRAPPLRRLFAARTVMLTQTWVQMGMPITVCLADAGADRADVAAVETWFAAVDRRFNAWCELRWNEEGRRG